MKRFLIADSSREKKKSLREISLSAALYIKSQRSLRLLFLHQLIVLHILLFSCKKYEDGPLITFRSKAERLSNHWKPEKKYINGDEDILTDEEMNTVYTFDKGGVFIKRIPNGPYFNSYNGTWEFIEKKEKIKTWLNYTYFGNAVVEEQEYEILKLKEKELWLRYTDKNSDEIELHFIPE